MSFLTTPELPEFTKAVISFWFQVSQDALDAAQAEEDDFNSQDDPGDPPPFLGLVPLLIFGKEGTGASKVESNSSSQDHTETFSLHSCATVDVVYSGVFPAPACANWDSTCSDSSREEHWSTTTISYSATPGKPTEPSYVAIDGGGNLRINFESTKMAAVSGFCGLTKAEGAHTPGGHTDLCCHYPAASGCDAGEYCGPAGWPGNFWGIMIWVFGLIGVRLLTAVADQCEISGGAGGERVDSTFEYGPIPTDFGTGALNVSKGPSLAGDAWHHVLISVDMSGGAVASSGGISASCTMYLAIDDQDYKTGSYPLEDTNQVVPGGAAAVTGMPGDENCGPGSYSLPSMSVPSAPVGIPGTGKYQDRIRQVEMAELLFFTDQTLDTSVEGNRRHFITDKGHPTNTWPLFIPLRKFAYGDPSYWEPGADNPAFAPPLFDPSAWPTGIKGLGIAEIDLTKCAWNWQMGRNIGKLSGKVERTGKIKEYDPSDPPRVQAG